MPREGDFDPSLAFPLSAVTVAGADRRTVGPEEQAEKSETELCRFLAAGFYFY